MKKENHIGILIEKFRNGTVSHEELAVLLSYFRENQPQGELLDFYEHVWEKASGDNIEANSENSFSGILNEINREEGQPFGKTIRWTGNLWKYAALFIIAFAISWLVNNLVHDRKSAMATTYQNIEVPYGSRSKVELPDGSKVTLNAGSKLRYANGFGNTNRYVDLKGEAFFEVKKDLEHPFYVNTPGIKIKVTGTTFNVKAYPEEKSIETTLITGTIQLYNTGNPKEDVALAVLTPGQKALYEKGRDHEILVTDVLKPELAVAWTDDQFVFDNVSFEELAIRIERWYDVEIILNYPALKNARFSGRFDKETIEQAMKALTLVTPFHFKIEKNKISIYK